jgi:hypothetical protein
MGWDLDGALKADLASVRGLLRSVTGEEPPAGRPSATPAFRVRRSASERGGQAELHPLQRPHLHALTGGASSYRPARFRGAVAFPVPVALVGVVSTRLTAVLPVRLVAAGAFATVLVTVLAAFSVVPAVLPTTRPARARPGPGRRRRGLGHAAGGRGQEATVGLGKKLREPKASPRSRVVVLDFFENLRVLTRECVGSSTAYRGPGTDR